LVARIEALLRRVPAGSAPRPETNGVDQFGDVCIDRRGTAVTRAGEAINLSAREFQLLRYFSDRPGTTLSREELLTEVWGYSASAYTRTVDVHVASLRQKLEPDPRQPRYIVTVQASRLQVHAVSERAPTRAFVIPAAVVLAVLLLLAVLVYRWSNQISEATSVRLADSLQMSMTNWRLNLYRDISDVAGALHVDSESSGNLDLYARRFRDWSAGAEYRELAEGLFILRDVGSVHFGALRLNNEGSRFEPVDLPRQMAILGERLKNATPAAERAGRQFFPRGLAGWRFEPETLTLVRRIESLDTAWLVVALDRETIRNRILPDLARRYFMGVDGLDYLIAVVPGTPDEEPLYSSDPRFGVEEVRDADGRMDIFGNGTERRYGSPIYVFHELSENARMAGLAGSLGPSWFPLVNESADAPGWQLVVRHRRGGALGAFVAELRRRDLAISFAVIILLAVSVAMLILASLRASRLAKLQMDFVTTVSHELRSPLAIISSAAENIAHGVVGEGSQMKQYGRAIENQTRRLSRLVEEVLLFAATSEDRHRYHPRPLDVGELVDAALAGTEDLIDAAQFTVEKDIPSGLPQVRGDLSALTQCLQNLLTNALKYGGPERWIGIRACVEDGPGGREVWIAVSDRGIGIDAKDLPRIFEPFYRGASAAAAQIHGAGLGLSLAKTIAEAMRGQLSVASRPGEGTTFTLRLPVAGEGGETSD
ncbi:MAG TPA: ATP-binding protein, partial [Terriglobia bacterium]|nr:ATP-binding protein [Terriglobia bacterium]